MVMIVGWGAGETRDRGEIAPLTCPRCRNEVFLHHIESEKEVSLYFIPLVPYGTDEYLACPICHSGLQLKPENRQSVDRMRAATSQFRRGLIGPEPYRARVEQFWQTLGVSPSGTQVVQSPPTVPPPAAMPAQAAAEAARSLGDQLRGLAELHAEGVLTDAEFAETKRRILRL